jgi:hypothetical protein
MSIQETFKQQPTLSAGFNVDAIHVHGVPQHYTPSIRRAFILIVPYHNWARYGWKPFLEIDLQE